MRRLPVAGSSGARAGAAPLLRGAVLLAVPMALLASTARSAPGPADSWSIAWSSVEGGGEWSTSGSGSGSWSLAGSGGASDPGRALAGSWLLDGGFWPGVSGAPIGPPCPGDIDGSGAVDGGDLGALLGAWGTADPLYDLDGSGTIDGADLGALLGGWGDCP